MHLLCKIVGHDISSHHYSFKHIVWDLLGRISGSNMFTVMFLTLFSLYYFQNICGIWPGAGTFQELSVGENW